MERMDADTTSARGAHFDILERFRTGQTRLLVGTQIVAKGHDFPAVSCAVVLGADHILRMPDFRSAERCHAPACTAPARSADVTAATLPHGTLPR